MPKALHIALVLSALLLQCFAEARSNSLQPKKPRPLARKRLVKAAIEFREPKWEDFVIEDGQVKLLTDEKNKKEKNYSTAIDSEGAKKKRDLTGLAELFGLGNLGKNNKAGGSENQKSASGKFGYDDNAKKSLDGGEAPPLEPPGGGSTPPGGPVTPPDKNLEIPSYWWPMCVLIDESIDQGEANEAVKGMVKMAAENCSVKVVVTAVTVKNLRDQYDWVNAQAKKMCNFKVNGLSRSSVSTMMPDSFPLTAAKMCGAYIWDNSTPPNRVPDPKVAGCAEMASGASQTEMGLLDNGHKGMKFAADGEAAASIEVKIGRTAKVLAHEAQGHSQLGFPNGTRAGNDIGTWEELKDPKKKLPSSPNYWTSEGCTKMVQNSYTNTQKHPYDPNQTTYYNKLPPDRVYDMAQAPPLFSPPPGNPVDPPMPPPQETPPPAAPPEVVKREPPFKGEDDLFAKAKPDAKDPGPGSKHKKKSLSGGSSPTGEAGQMGTDVSFRKGQTSRTNADAEGNEKDSSLTAGSDEGVEAKGRDKVGFGYDDNADKGLASGEAGRSASEKGTQETSKQESANERSKGGLASKNSDTENAEKSDGVLEKTEGVRKKGNILDQAREGNRIVLEDEFFTRLRLGDQSRERTEIGGSLRKGQRMQRTPASGEIYQNSGGAQ